jgi:O-methyltransferase involved in polyketide biosynthesis
MARPSPRAEAISPTAHYTAFVWARNGLSHPALVTTTGRVLFNSLRPAMALSRTTGGATLEGFLLARHRLIDHLLEQAIARGEVSQVIEIACGLSPRGWRFAQRHGDRLTYVETDLPQMVARKRSALERTGPLGLHHRLAELDALTDEGPSSLRALVEDLDRQRGLAVITEGLLSYLARSDVDGLWRRIADTLSAFPSGLYLSDLHLRADTSGPQAAAFRVALAAFVRGSVHIHFGDEAEAEAALSAAGFGSATLHNPADLADRLRLHRRDAALVRVIEATS